MSNAAFRSDGFFAHKADLRQNGQKTVLQVRRIVSADAKHAFSVKQCETGRVVRADDYERPPLGETLIERRAAHEGLHRT